eukprot:7884327-Lingulodinium_polyedra.AAC.1
MQQEQQAREQPAVDHAPLDQRVQQQAPPFEQEGQDVDAPQYEVIQNVFLRGKWPMSALSER